MSDVQVCIHISIKSRGGLEACSPRKLDALRSLLKPGWDRSRAIVEVCRVLHSCSHLNARAPVTQLVRASDQSSEDPSSNPGWTSMSFFDTVHTCMYEHLLSQLTSNFCERKQLAETIYLHTHSLVYDFEVSLQRYKCKHANFRSISKKRWFEPPPSNSPCLWPCFLFQRVSALEGFYYIPS